MKLIVAVRSLMTKTLYGTFIEGSQQEAHSHLLTHTHRSQSVVSLTIVRVPSRNMSSKQILHAHIETKNTERSKESIEA